MAHVIRTKDDALEWIKSVYPIGQDAIRDSIYFAKIKQFGVENLPTELLAILAQSIATYEGNSCVIELEKEDEVLGIEPPKELRQTLTPAATTTDPNEAAKNRAATIFSGIAANPNFHLSATIAKGEIINYLDIAIGIERRINETYDSGVELDGEV